MLQMTPVPNDASLQCQSCTCSVTWSQPAAHLAHSTFILNVELMMTSYSDSRLPPVQVGDNVRVPVPKVDRGRTDPGNLLGIVTTRRGFIFFDATKARLVKTNDLFANAIIFIMFIKISNKHNMNCTIKLKTSNAPVVTLKNCIIWRGIIVGLDADYVIEPLPANIKLQRHRRGTSESSDQMLGLQISQTHLIYMRELTGNCAQASSNLSRKRRSLHSLLKRRTNYDLQPFINTYREARNPYFDSYEHTIHDRLHSNGYYPPDFQDSYRRSMVGEDLYIETAVFVDRDLLRHMDSNFPQDTEDQVIKFVLAMINAVQLLYNDESLGHRVKFVLKRLEILYDDPYNLRRTENIDQFLTNFCKWQKEENPPHDRDPLHWDHSLILTGLDLYTNSEGRLNSKVVGLAPVSGMCHPSSSCTVNEGRHFESVYVVAHEIGHNLGMRHDGMYYDNNCDPGRYLMSPTLGSGKISWSPCSRRYLDKFLMLNESTCLRDKSEAPSRDLEHDYKTPPGQRFSADQQCMLKHGVGSHHADNQPQEEICQDLHCRRDHYTWTSHPALEGTSCGQGKWCVRGECKEDPSAPNYTNRPYFPQTSSAIHRYPSSTSLSSVQSANGGEWGVWTECRTSCLYGADGILSSGSTGLSLSERRCRSCRGEYRFRVCSAADQCRTGQRNTLQDFADEACMSRSQYNSYNRPSRAIQIKPTGLTSCEVMCETTDSRGQGSQESFPDGTVCLSPTRFPAYCVQGVCTEFRCEPDALYGADPITCHPDMGSHDPHRPLGPSSSEETYGHRNNSVTESYLPFITTRATKSEPKWTSWQSASTCRFSCLSTARGIQLVSRHCQGHGCQGINKNIQLCTPTHSSCDRLKTPFEHASAICAGYQTTVSQLSGIGMQLSSTSDDPDRACIVACQDMSLTYRFYRVNGRDGWFPFGTDCARGQEGRLAYCLNGKCLDFSKDGTPLRDTAYTQYENSRSLTIGVVKREARKEEKIIESHVRGKRDITSNSYRIPGSFDNHFLTMLVDELNSTISSNISMDKISSSSIDLRNPVDISSGPDIHIPTLENVTPKISLSNNEKQNNSKRYGWKVITSPCSVTCGEGLEEVVVLCMGKEGVVEEKLCGGPPSAVAGFRSCFTSIRCSRQYGSHRISPVGHWLTSLMQP
ncbi:unnamed protein product, partial [Meganyctiphanes norvegica]